MFKKYGTDVQLIYIASSGTNIQALLGGSLDLSAPGMSGVVLAAARGAPGLTIGAMTNEPPMTLYVQPEITKTDQLKGQSLQSLTAKVIDKCCRQTRQRRVHRRSFRQTLRLGESRLQIPV